jgi:hypothetical protein
VISDWIQPTKWNSSLLIEFIQPSETAPLVLLLTFIDLEVSHQPFIRSSLHNQHWFSSHFPASLLVP